MNRPTTHTAVADFLKARADFRGIPAQHESAYLLGMAEMIIAEQNREILRLETLLAEIRVDLDELQNTLEAIR